MATDNTSEPPGPSPEIEFEVANTLTHGAGFLLTLAGAAWMAAATRDAAPGVAASCLIYTTALVAVYGISTLSHAVRHPHLRHLFRIWDQGAIYCLISGTYTPFVWAFVPPPYRWLVLMLIWLAAAVGLVTKVVLQHHINSTTTYSYIALGWLPALALLNYVSVACMLSLAAGGVVYTLGTIFLRLDDRHRYFHATWHVFVILGSACHYVAIAAFVVSPFSNA